MTKLGIMLGIFSQKLNNYEIFTVENEFEDFVMKSVRNN